MDTRNTRNNSYLLSVTFHIVLLFIFFLVRFSIEPDESEYVTVGFGSGLNMGSSGPIGKEVKTEKDVPNKEKTVKKKEEQKKVELPETKNKDEENVITAADKKKEEKPKEAEKIKPLKEEENKTKGSELAGEGEGGFGFEIDFGGKGTRKIYSYNLPAYPEGVSKEIDVKLRFTILPDGTVGKIFPLIKADARLEIAAMNSLRQWRFEPLPQSAKQVEQTVVIIFPYRLQ